MFAFLTTYKTIPSSLYLQELEICINFLVKMFTQNSMQPKLISRFLEIDMEFVIKNPSIKVCFSFNLFLILGYYHNN